MTKLAAAYIAFIAALLVAVISQGSQYAHSWVIIFLLSASLPSLVAFLLLDFIIRVGQLRHKSMFRGLAVALGFLPSLLGVDLIVCHFSVIAAVLFILLIGFWSLVILIVADLGRDPRSDV